MGRSWVRLELDVADFDPTPFQARATDGLGATVSLATMAGIGAGEEDQRRLWELDCACAQDMPGTVESFTFEEYRAIRLGKASARPDGQVVALESANPDTVEWVGLCLAAHAPDTDWAFVDMTGVRRSHRRRGLSLALKLIAIETVGRWGVPVLRTLHHPDNEAAIAANLALGFQPSDFALPAALPDPE